MKYLNPINFLSKKYSTILQTTPKFDCIPKYSPPTEDDIKILKNFLDQYNKILVITGAGISTESGIPDYRSEGVGLYARSNHRPMQHLEFLKSSKSRQRYWARNYIGWPRFSQSLPNVTHKILRDLEIDFGKIGCIVTQNVDGLHGKAGSQNVIELHGTAFRVICLKCGKLYSRHIIQDILKNNNTDMRVTVDMVRPDGDVDISQEMIENFKPPLCDTCDGPLKPDIIFFGDNVPKDRVTQVRKNVSDCEAILVLGSSLSTYSGYRIILQAKEENKDVGIINIGQTRADQHAKFKISTRCGEILPRILL